MQTSKTKDSQLHQHSIFLSHDHNLTNVSIFNHCGFTEMTVTSGSDSGFVLTLMLYSAVIIAKDVTYVIPVQWLSDLALMVVNEIVIQAILDLFLLKYQLASSTQLNRLSIH